MHLKQEISIQTPLEIFHISRYKGVNPKPFIEIERHRTQSYFVIVPILDESATNFISRLKDEYGSGSENYLKDIRMGAFFKNGTGTGLISIQSYVRF